MSNNTTPPQSTGTGKRKRRVGVLGYGNLGQYLCQAILQDDNVSQSFELAFVWNRTASKIPTVGTAADGELVIPKECVMENIEDFKSFRPDIIVEVAHPSITLNHVEQFLTYCDYFVGSPTAFADPEVEAKVRSVIKMGAESGLSHGLYIPSGALWGANDIQKMASRGTLHALSIEMTFHSHSLKLNGWLKDKLDNEVSEWNKNDATQQGSSNAPCVLYEGPVRELAPFAPNNVNTMACACLAGHTLGFDKVQAKLIADPNADGHVIVIDIHGPPDANGVSGLHVRTKRVNPAKKGAVTGSATYVSFLSSMLLAEGKGSGMHFC
eukprot:TRINITY_DN4257_c0_g2_i1.p1 TRINITY_DN4257_c0_g2~~TRINITY_DN4257_c0_g2_i1.p1  ORF type:complete len:324 (-),score=60.53 TRINITY_DN4257_c0_g2_i1:2-973(-)